MAQLLQDLLLAGAQRHPERQLLWHKGRWHTYGDLATLTGRFASFLRDAGIRPGDRVAFLLENSADYVASYYGALRAGAVAVGLNHNTVAQEIATIFQDCQPRVVVAQRSVLKHLAGALEQIPESLRTIVTVGGVMPSEHLHGREAAPISSILADDAAFAAGDDCGPRAGSPEDLSSIIYTSGTTGNPKGVMLSHRNLIENGKGIVEYLSLTSADRVMCVLPFFFSYGNSLLTTHLMAGGSVVLHNGFVFPNVILDEMVEHRCTGFSGVPSTYALLLHRSSFRTMRFPDLRYVTIAGGGLPASAQAELQQVIPSAKVVNMYGQTEGAARLSYLEPDCFQDKLGSIGMGMPGVELRVMADGRPVQPGETGEILARGPNIMMGYWGSPEETAQVVKDGWLHTGDLATVDEDGYIFIVSRKKDIIKHGAFRIAPNGIESVLVQHPAVAEAAVVGTPDPLMGEAIVAYLVLKPDEAVEEQALVAFCRGLLPTFKIPKIFRMVRELPKTPSGKVQKHVLRDREETQASNDEGRT